MTRSPMMPKPLWIAVLCFLLTAGCQPMSPVYYGRTRTGGREETLSRWAQRDSERRDSVSEARHVKPVGFTQKNFDGLETEPDPFPPSRGKVQWSEEPENHCEPADELTPADFIPVPERTSEPLPPKLAQLPPDLSAPEPARIALAESIENPNRDADFADITFLPVVKEETAPTPPSCPREPANWREATNRAIELLQAEIDRRVCEGEICSAEEARLRLLLLTTGNIPGAAEKIAGMDPNLQRFWEQECRGLGRLIEAEEGRGGEGAANTAWTDAIPDFQEGMEALKIGMPMNVRKSLFVKEPSVFGFYEERPASFVPGETVNAYYELDNVVCREKEEGNGCEIAVLCRRELTDSLNRPVLDSREKLCAGQSASQLRDIVLNLSVRLPDELPPGTYYLKTSFLDRNGLSSEPASSTMEICVD